MSCKNQLHQILALDANSNKGGEPYIDTTLLATKAQQAGKSTYAQKILFWHEMLGIS